MTSVFIVDYSGLRLRRSPDEWRRKDRRRPGHGAMRDRDIYFRWRGAGHGLSRGNGIFEARRSRKAIILKAVLIKAQPRYIAAMPHTPICPPPPRASPCPRRRSIVHSSATPVPSNPFHSGTIVCRDTSSLSPSCPRLPPFSFSLYRSSIREYFFPQLLFLSLLLPSLSLSIPSRAHAIISDCEYVCVKGAIFLHGPASLF